MIKINYFKKFIMQNDVIDMLDKCWCDMIWLDADINILHVKKNNLNVSWYVLSI
jgi:hypothetical protein